MKTASFHIKPGKCKNWEKSVCFHLFWAGILIEQEYNMNRKRRGYESFLFLILTLQCDCDKVIPLNKRWSLSIKRKLYLFNVFVLDEKTVPLPTVFF